jgi:hypothetical protein
LEKATELAASIANSGIPEEAPPRSCEGKGRSQAKRLDGIKVAKEELVTVKAKVTAQAGIAYDLYRKLLTGDPEA